MHAKNKINFRAKGSGSLIIKYCEKISICANQATKAGVDLKVLEPLYT